MSLPLYDLSGLESILNVKHNDSSLTLASHAAQVRAFQRCKDTVVHEVFTEGKETYALIAIVRANRTAQPAQHIAVNLSHAVRRAIKQRKPERSGSPRRQPSDLRAALVALSASFSKASMSPETLLPQTGVAAALLRPAAQSVVTLHYGSGSRAPVVTQRDGAIVTPSHRESHFESNTGIQEAVYTDIVDANLVLGSFGLWEHTHARQAAVNAAAFSPPLHEPASPAHVSHSRSALPPSLRGPAALVVLSALRSIVRKCSASHDARLACLTNVKQLDRIPPGSRAEAFGGIIVPRFRGDVHSDMTAVVASVSFTAGASSPARTRSGAFSCAMARLRHVSSESALAEQCSSLRRQASKGCRMDGSQPFSRFLESFRSRRGLAASADNINASPRRHAEAPQSDSQSASPLRKAAHAHHSSVDSLAPEGASDSSPAALRWHAVRVFVRAQAGEARLRQQLWREALDAARSSSPPAPPAARVPAPLTVPDPVRSASTSGRQPWSTQHETASVALDGTSSTGSARASQDRLSSTSEHCSDVDESLLPQPTAAVGTTKSLECADSFMQLRIPSLIPAELDADHAPESTVQGDSNGAWPGGLRGGGISPAALVF